MIKGVRTNIKLFVTILSLVFNLGCGPQHKKGPNISKVKLDIQVDHFEKDFFSLDTNNLQVGLNILKRKYGDFYKDFFYNIAAFSMDEDQFYPEVCTYLRTYRFIYDSIDYYIPNLNQQIKAIENALKRAKIYFPGRKLPSKVITYIGPIDGFGSFVSKSGIGIGLQQFLGPTFSGYKKEAIYLENLFGKQKLQQFSPDYIAPSAILCWINREFPDKAGKYTLQKKLIEEGRKLYLLKILLPDLSDATILGYTKEQINWCQNNRILIEHYFKHDNLLKTTDPEKIVAYLSDNQRPVGLPEEFVDNTGKYLGFLMVSKFMEAHRKTTLKELMLMKLGQIKKVK